MKEYKKYKELIEKSVDVKDLLKEGKGGVHLYFYYKGEIHNLYFRVCEVPKWYPYKDSHYIQYITL